MGAGIRVASDIHPSRSCLDVRILFPEQNPRIDFFNFGHTHPLGAVDVPFVVFLILST